MSEERKDKFADNDFKYVLADMENIYLGARFTFGELLLQEMVPFKLKTIVKQYILKEADPDTTLESQFYYMNAGTFLYDTFCQLRIRVKVNVQVEKRTLLGARRLCYEEKVFKLKDLTAVNLAKKKACGMIIREIMISKLGLMTFSV